jgi:hypothetical protein
MAMQGKVPLTAGKPLANEVQHEGVDNGRLKTACRTLQLQGSSAHNHNTNPCLPMQGSPSQPSNHDITEGCTLPTLNHDYETPAVPHT